MYHRATLRRRLSAMVFGLGLLGIISSMTPATTLAIPVKGDYQFTGGELLGTFTVANDQLTAWSFTDPLNEPSYQWTNLDPTQSVLPNDASFFGAFSTDKAVRNVFISWDDLGFGAFLGSDASRFGSFGIKSVPEHSSALLTGLGLLLLLGYGWRQRRHAGSQVG